MTLEPKPPRTARVVVLASGAGTLLQALLDVPSTRRPCWKVTGVLTDRKDAQALDRARSAGVPTATVLPADFTDRATWDLAVARAIDVFNPDLVVLAGFMRILGEPFLQRYAGRTINTHPALLPAFPGAHGVRDALNYGVKVTGASVILVDGGTDSGPVIAQRCVPVHEDDDERSLHERIKVVERVLLVEVVQRMAECGWSVEGRSVRLGTSGACLPDPTSQENRT